MGRGATRLIVSRWMQMVLEYPAPPERYSRAAEAAAPRESDTDEGVEIMVGLKAWKGAREQPGTASGMRAGAEELYMRMAVSGLVDPRRFLPSVPEARSLPARTGRLSLEIVSHCWGYHFLLAYQLSSLVNHPPTELSVTMTLYYSREDQPTSEMLEFFGAIEVPGVRWNWVALDRERLFRRAIGRNLAALDTRADCIWFTDCDVVFHEGCLDGLGELLQGRQDLLVFPRVERTTSLLAGNDPMLTAARDQPLVIEIEPARFTPRHLDVAKGPVQITHGDVARAVGYCASLPVYQRPADHWRKAWEDRAFRWVLRTDGTPLEVPGVYRIRHAAKGRYMERTLGSRIRGTIRRVESGIRERHAARRPKA
jgi:hypothetical protein